MSPEARQQWTDRVLYLIWPRCSPAQRSTWHLMEDCVWNRLSADPLWISPHHSVCKLIKPVHVRQMDNSLFSKLMRKGPCDFHFVTVLWSRELSADYNSALSRQPHSLGSITRNSLSFIQQDLYSVWLLSTERQPSKGTVFSGWCEWQEQSLHWVLHSKQTGGRQVTGFLLCVQGFNHLAVIETYFVLHMHTLLPHKVSYL